MCQIKTSLFYLRIGKFWKKRDYEHDRLRVFFFFIRISSETNTTAYKYIVLTYIRTDVDFQKSSEKLSRELSIEFMTCDKERCRRRLFPLFSIRRGPFSPKLSAGWPAVVLGWKSVKKIFVARFSYAHVRVQRTTCAHTSSLLAVCLAGLMQTKIPFFLFFIFLAEKSPFWMVRRTQGRTAGRAGIKRALKRLEQRPRAKTGSILAQNTNGYTRQAGHSSAVHCRISFLDLNPWCYDLTKMSLWCQNTVAYTDRTYVASSRDRGI